MCKRARSSICISLADKQQCILIPGENTPQAWFIKLDCQLLQDSIGGFVFCSASSNRSSFPQKLKVASRKQEFFDDQSKYPSCITARGTVSVPLQHGSGPLLQPSITMRGTASVPLRYRFGTARALYYNARRPLGTASVPLGPSITMRSADTPFAFYKVLIRSEWWTSKKTQRPTETHKTQP